MEGTYGAEMVGKLKKMKIFVSGLGGLGIETAKNLVLAGPHTVTIHDDKLCEVADLGSNFYLNERDIGKGRAQSVLGSLKDLNPNSNVLLHTGPIKESDLQGFQVVCFLDDSETSENLSKFNNFCRSQPSPIVFIVGFLQGAAAGVFTDFGPKHHVFDGDGEPVKTIIIDSILEGQEHANVTIDGDRHLLSSGDHVRFEEVKGMSDDSGKNQTFGQDDVITDINQTHVIKTTKNPKRFLIGNSTQLKAYQGGGIATQVKVTQSFEYKSYAENLSLPAVDFGYMDFTKFGRAEQLHFAHLALQEFKAKNGRLPKLHSSVEADKVVEIAKSILETHKKTPDTALVVDLDETVVRKCALYATVELTALASIFGGVIAQEITKQTGKYTPINQWLHFDAFEMLSESVPADATPIGSRYDHQIAIFGKAFQDKLCSQKVFIVGCGALGCEYMKAVAMTGLGTKGRVFVTDDDHIELSNLSRQFLFRRKHVGKAKATSAASVVLDMNPDLRTSLKSFEVRVEPKTEDVFDEPFWQSLDFVVNALDNNLARRYTDGKCVLFEKPLFESGTLGTKANSAVCIPHKTPSYSQGVTAGEGAGIAKCTIRNFPAIPLHCIEWAREMFDEWFTSGPEIANAFLENPEEFLKKARDNQSEQLSQLKEAKSWLDLSSQSRNFQVCVDLMLLKFTKYYNHGICDLTHAFPQDARMTDKKTGTDLGLFWHGAKRFPQVAQFDVNNDLHLKFVYYGANIIASVFGLPEKSIAEVKSMCAGYRATAWVATGVKIELDTDKKDEEEDGEMDDDEEMTSVDDDKDEVAALEAHLKSLNPSSISPLNPADFEKDDDTNHHIDVITAACNLRSSSYFIKDSKRSEVRMTAGRIIPAIATTTASITGFIQLEILKYVKEADLYDYRMVTMNLAMNVFVCENLPDPMVTKTGFDQETYMEVVAIPDGFTIWDKVVIRGTRSTTMGEFFKMVEEKHHGAVIDFLTLGDKTLYSEVMPSETQMMQERLRTSLMGTVEAIVGPPLAGSKFLMLDSTVTDPDGETGVIPKIMFTFDE